MKTKKYPELFYFLLTFSILMFGCNSNKQEPNKPDIKDTIVHKTSAPPIINCDTSKVDCPEIKDYKKALQVWLEDSKLSWFIEYRQSAWREAKVWFVKEFPIDSNALLKCKSEQEKNAFLYIPNRHWIKKNGEYIKFYIVNNSQEALKIPALDETIDDVFSSVSSISKDSNSSPWLFFQKRTGIIECGNSIHTITLAPKMAIEAHIESDYLNMGLVMMNYRLEIKLKGQTLTSNSIQVELMKEQVPYLGKEFDR